MGLFMAAWLIGEGIISYRAVKQTKAPPMPGALLASSGLFALLALAAESDRIRPLATVAAFGIDIAAFMNLYPPITGGGAPTVPAGSTKTANYAPTTPGGPSAGRGA
jgi:hypothetical protein